MNQSSTYNVDAVSRHFPESKSVPRAPLSTLGRYVRKFWKSSKIYSAEYRTQCEHQSFRDANLLDHNIGPEISRTLR